MPLINLPSGNTIYMSTYEYYFMLKDEDMDEFYQSCMADNLGVYIGDPFASNAMRGKLEIEEDPSIPEELKPDKQEVTDEE